MSFSYNFVSGLSAGSTINFACNALIGSPTQVKIGNDLWAFGATFTWLKPLSGECTSVEILPGFVGSAVNPIAAGTSYPNGTNVFPVTATTVTQNFVVPAIGSTQDVFLGTPFNGNVGDIIYINGSQYQVTAFVNNYPSGAAELPPGRMGCNAGGRTWLALPDGKSYIASDLTGDPSGTQQYGFTDAVLKVTENTLLAGGGAFRVPAQAGNITAMTATAVLDASLGQGPLEIFTPSQVFSNNSPPDRTTWQNLQYPIQSVSLINSGSESQWATFNVNNDTMFRSVDGIRSLLLARRDFNVWGNVPNSEEVEPIISADNSALLNYASGVNFDNRALFTANPVQTTQGTYHNLIIALNFDSVSSLAGKSASVYDGIWTGLNILQLVSGSFGDLTRCFAFVLNTATSQIELWEIMPTLPDPDYLPVNQLAQWSSPNNQFDNITVPIPMSMTSPVLDFGQKNPRDREYLQLNNGEISVDHMSGDVLFEVWYKADEQTVWTLWHAWKEVAGTTVPVFRPRMGLGTPSPDDCDPITNRPMREGYQFQVKIIITGNARFKSARFSAVTIPQPKYQPRNCSTESLQMVETLEEGGKVLFLSGTIVVGPTGPPGPQGAPGAIGATGPPGVGVPVGGTAGQVLAKIDSTNFNTQWVNQSGGGGATDVLQVQVFS